jgi:hypothetical protein
MLTAEADRAEEAGDLGVGEATPAEALETGGVRLAAAEAADVEGVAAERGLEGGVVELGVVREGDDRGAAIELEPGERLVGPEGDARDAGETGLGREGCARVDDDDLEAGERRHLRERLRHVDGADHDEPERRVERRQEDRRAGDLDGEALVAGGGVARCVKELGGDSFRRGLVRVEEPLLAGREGGGEDDRALVTAVAEDLVEVLGLHRAVTPRPRRRRGRGRRTRGRPPRPSRW